MVGVGGLVLNERVSLRVEGCAVLVDFFCLLVMSKVAQNCSRFTTVYYLFTFSSCSFWCSFLFFGKTFQLKGEDSADFGVCCLTSPQTKKQ